MLHRLGLRYRIQERLIPNSTRTTDIVFPRAKLAVYVDGCFWHGCQLHWKLPKSNADWWAAKIASNRERDDDTNRRLEDLRWRVLRIWEHTPLSEAVRVVLQALSDENEPS